MSSRTRVKPFVVLALLGVAFSVGRVSSAGAPPATRIGAADAQEQKIRQALEQRLEVEIVEQPLDVVIDGLESELGIEIVVDRRALDELRVDADSPFTFRGSGLSFRSALELMLHEHELSWTVRDEVLYITDEDRCWELMRTKLYDVTDLVARRTGDRTAWYDLESLYHVISTCIEPLSWNEVGGPGSLAEYTSDGVAAIVVRQTWAAHEQIEVVLGELRRVGRHGSAQHNSSRVGLDEGGSGGQPPKAKPQPMSGSQKPTVEQERLPEERVRQALGKPVTLDCRTTPLFGVVSYLQDVFGIHVRLDKKSLYESGLDADTPVAIRVSGITLRSALDLALDPLDLTWDIRREVLWITCRAEAEESVRTKVYDVSDLVSPLDEDSGSPVTAEWLVDLITFMVQPTSWDSVGGPGSIAPFQAPGINALVISQSRRGHEDIISLLANLRGIRREAAAKQAHRKPPPPKQPGGETSDRSEQATALKAHPYRDAVVKGSNEFAFQLYARLSQQEEGNLFLSPHSISIALAMAYGGARGETGREMADCLHLTLPPDRLHTAFASLQALLGGQSERHGYELRVANRLWGQQGYGFLDEFLAITGEYYGAELAELDFGRSEAARTTINAWIEKQTAGKIKEAIGPGVLNSWTRLVLTNAVYFIGKWAEPFSESATRPAPFFTGSTETDVPMMCQRERLRYGTFEEIQILEKPYVGEHLSMVILLPRERAGIPADLEQSLSAEKLQSWLAQLRSREIKVYLPRFRFESGFDLRHLLASMGMPRAFDRGAADFSGMNGGVEPLWLEAVIHRAYVDVNETGTEAAATTAITGSFGGPGMLQAPVPVFRVDHPFLFVIRDTRSGSILFMGRIVQPEIWRE